MNSGGAARGHGLGDGQAARQPIVLILDAYFAVAPVFALAASLWSLAHHAPWVTLIVRAKNNYVAYFQAPPQAAPRPSPSNR